MKKYIVLLFIPAFLFSCKKQITDKAIPGEVSMAAPGAGSSCKAVSLSFVSGDTWINEMQKWYGSDGRVAYLKANLGFNWLPWGEVTYHNNNQVYVKNTQYNDTLLRVTLDAQQRPAASYFMYSHTYEPFIDTSYYYFTGNRLDSVLSIFRPFLDKTRPTFRKMLFSYDMYGNLVRIYEIYDANLGLNDRWELFYDYSKPVAGMLPSFEIDRPYRLMQYLDLVDFPVHHQLVKVSRTLLGLTYHLNYSDYQLDANGLVQSYKETLITNVSSTRTFYTGWNCSPTSQIH